jgi:glyoxylase-like metal-dependent hydrolase (beta-lactamase superfamily II)
LVIDFRYDRKNCQFAADSQVLSASPLHAFWHRYNGRFYSPARTDDSHMKVILVPVTPFQQNCSIVICDATRRAAVVDPGGDIERIIEEVERQGVTVDKILLTHGHLDHCGGAKALADHYGVQIEGPHREDAFWIDQLPAQTQRFGFSSAEAFTPERWLVDGDTVQFGNESMEVYFCPGHTPGHVVFFSREHKLAFVGDVLFAGSVGRTDFPRGNHAELIRSIREKLWPLGDEVTFVPGHGPASTFGEERRTNPFVRDGVTA